MWLNFPSSGATVRNPMQGRIFPVRFFLSLCFAVLASVMAPLTAAAQERIGILMLHGKNPGSNVDPYFGFMKENFERQGWLVAFPDMPWSRGRYLDGNLDKALDEIAGHVKNLRGQGATKIVIAGHSMGVPTGMAYAARSGDVDALVQLAPGHIPLGYYRYPSLKVVRDSIDEARALVAAGKGDSNERFNDINQGRPVPVTTTAKHFLSYFDPTSDAEMSVTAPRIPAKTSVMTVIGQKDPLFSQVKSYYVDKLPTNSKNKYLEVSGGHLDTPRVANDAVIAWINATFSP
jgi:pimeloyl-ACP methyl ester carboxylesterase